MSDVRCYSAEDFRAELTQYMVSALHYAATSAEQDDRNALLPRRELNRLLRLQIPEFFRLAELDDGVDRSDIIHMASVNFVRTAPKLRMPSRFAPKTDAEWQSHAERLAHALARDISEVCISNSPPGRPPGQGLAPESFRIWDHLSSALVYILRVELLRSVPNAEFERIWWEDRAATAMERLADWMTLQRIPARQRIRRTETAISCIATDACRNYVLTEFSKDPSGAPTGLTLPHEGPTTETITNLVRDWARHPPKDNDIDSRIALDSVLGRLDPAIEKAVNDDAKRRSRTTRRSTEAED